MPLDPAQRHQIEQDAITAAWVRIPEHPATHSDNIRPLFPEYPATCDALP